MAGRSLFKLYQRRRIININVNVVVAGLLALGLTLIPVHFTRYLDIHHKFVITAIAGGFDIIFDVVIYYALHWVANHWKPLRPKTEAEKQHHDAKPPGFLKDASLIQFERALLAPLYYVVAMGVNLTFLKMGYEREWALVWSFLIAITVTRVVHTVWGLKSGTFKDHAKRGTAVPVHPPAETKPGATPGPMTDRARAEPTKHAPAGR